MTASGLAMRHDHTFDVIGCPAGVVNNGVAEPPPEFGRSVGVRDSPFGRIGAGQIEAPDIPEQVPGIHVISDVIAVEIRGRDVVNSVGESSAEPVEVLR